MSEDKNKGTNFMSQDDRIALTRIDTNVTNIVREIKEIKDSIKAINGTVDAHGERLTEHSGQLKAIEQRQDRQPSAYKIIAWILGIVLGVTGGAVALIEYIR